MWSKTLPGNKKNKDGTTELGANFYCLFRWKLSIKILLYNKLRIILACEVFLGYFTLNYLFSY